MARATQVPLRAKHASHKRIRSQGRWRLRAAFPEGFYRLVLLSALM